MPGACCVFVLLELAADESAPHVHVQGLNENLAEEQALYVKMNNLVLSEGLLTPVQV